MENVNSRCGFATTEGSITALPVVPVKVRKRGSSDYVETYAMLDNGSNSTFCTDTLRERLNCSGTEKKVKLTTLGTSQDIISIMLTDLEVTDLDENNIIPLPEVLCRPNIPVFKTEIPTQEDVDRWQYLQGHVYLPTIKAEVELLIGANVPQALQPMRIIGSQDGGPYASKVALGWIINGPIGRKLGKAMHANFFTRTEVHPMCAACSDFLEASDINEKGMSRNDHRFMNIVESSVKKTSDNHYEISLPVKDDKLKMPNNRPQALNRMVHLKRKLQNNPKFREDYTSFVADIEQKGYARKVPSEKLNRNDGRVWYLPHHGIYHPKKPNKIRVVFDCSAEYQGTSLNQQLFQGPDLTNGLLGVLLRFRQEKVAYMTDVEAMFHQVRVPDDECDLLRFLWWPDGDMEQEVQEYQMTVHLFGATSSPSVANFALRRTAVDNATIYDKAVTDTVEKNFYVDDCLKSVSTSEEGIGQAKDLRDMMANGGFKLTKWISNDRKVLESIPEQLRAKDVKDMDLWKDVLPIERALGVKWCVNTDTFGFNVTVRQRPHTRRGILSIVSSVYDPLGLAAPFILPAKVLLQNLCRENLEWDDEISAGHKAIWQTWLDNLPEIANYTVPRCIIPKDFGEVKDAELHHFADASNVAYAAVSYIRIRNVRNEIHCTLLISKTRLAPIKAITIPRLELAAATLAIQLDRLLRKELELEIQSSTFWSDSTTVLQYLRNDTKRFHTYVANRVTFVRANSDPDQWRYVRSKDNPADEASRGSSLTAFLKNERWKCGPEFLQEPKSKWPVTPTINSPSSTDPEVKQSVVLFASNTRDSEEPNSKILKILQRFSSWTRLKKFVAWCIRCQLKFRVSRSQNAELKGRPLDIKYITVEEMKKAEEEILKCVQKDVFKEE